MARFKELVDYRNKILMKLNENKNIIKLIYYKDTSPLNKSTPLDEDGNIIDLNYKNIFPYAFVPNTTEVTDTYITIRLNGFKSINQSFKDGYVEIYAFTHKDLIRTNDGLRHDLIINEIDEMFNQSRVLGLGKLEFYSMSEIPIDGKDYYGMVISYRVVEFN